MGKFFVPLTSTGAFKSVQSAGEEAQSAGGRSADRSTEFPTIPAAEYNL